MQIVDNTIDVTVNKVITARLTGRVASYNQAKQNHNDYFLTFSCDDRNEGDHGGSGSSRCVLPVHVCACAFVCVCACVSACVRA